MNNKNHTISGMVFVGCMFIGIAIGMFLNNTGMGVLLGMGVGFIASAVIENNNRSDSSNSNE